MSGPVSKPSSDRIRQRSAAKAKAARDAAMEAAVRFADTRAISRAAYPHACKEDRQLRDLIDVALGRQAEGPG